MEKNQTNLKSKVRWCRLAAAGIIYAGLAIYLYQPYFAHFHRLQCLVILNLSLGSLGCFLLSRRWVSVFWASLFAGIIYGFGPFALGLTAYHPTAGFLAAMIPWLFCPAAFFGSVFSGKFSGRQAGIKMNWRWLSVPLSALPVVAIVVFFQLSTHFRLFAMPISTRLRIADLAGLAAPLVATTTEPSFALVGFYHVPIAPLAMGLSMLVAGRRLGIIAILVTGTALAFCDSILAVSPIIWLTLPVLCCSVLIGVGAQGLVSAGWTDKGWVGAISIIMAAFSIAALLPATQYFQKITGYGSEHTEIFIETAKMYILGTLAVAIIFFIARARLRIAPVRWAVLCSAMGLDVFLGARFIVDQVCF